MNSIRASEPRLPVSWGALKILRTFCAVIEGSHVVFRAITYARFDTIHTH